MYVENPKEPMMGGVGGWASDTLVINELMNEHRKTAGCRVQM